MIPITSVAFGEEEEKRVLEVLRSGMIAQGPVVAEFETAFADLCQVKHAVAVNNGTTSLIASLQVLDLKPGDEVITSPFTFIATLNAILATGATAVLADICEEDFNIDPTSVENLITERTKVIMPVHLYGQMANMKPLVNLAKKYNLTIVEDAAQAHGASYQGQMAGTFGLGSFSLYATKNLTTGEGGIITTNDDAYADRIRVMRNQGMRQRYEYVMEGNNYRLTDLQAALAIPQLNRYPETLQKRTSNAFFLSESLSDVEGLQLPKQLEGRKHVWHQYTVRLGPECAMTRDQFIEALTDAGIGYGIYYPKLVSEYAPYLDNERVQAHSTPVAANVVSQVVSLPVHDHLTQDDLNHVVRTVLQALKGKK